MSTILGYCSIATGHVSTHAPQVVHCHNASADTGVPSAMIDEGSFATSVWPDSGRPIAGSCLCKSKIMSRGESALPTALAGQTLGHCPHSVQESRSSRSFQVNCSRFFTPNTSADSKSRARIVVFPYNYPPLRLTPLGAVAQLGERLGRIEEVVSSNLIRSICYFSVLLSLLRRCSVDPCRCCFVQRIAACS